MMELLKSRNHMIDYGISSSQTVPAVPAWKRMPLPADLFDFPQSKTHIKMGPIKTGANGANGAYVADATQVADGVDASQVADGPRLLDGVDCIPLSELGGHEKYKHYQHYLNTTGSHDKSLGDAFESYISMISTDDMAYVATGKGWDTAYLKLSKVFNENGSSHGERVLIVAEEGAGLDVVMDLSETEDASTRYFGKQIIVAKKGSRVRLVKIQRLGEESMSFDTVIAHVEEGAVVEMVDLQLGAALKAVSREIELVGRHARSEIKTAYYGCEENGLDLSYTMSHGAPKTESIILGKGALAGKSSKVFRGNLFFKTGATESVGREQEFVTLLSKNAVSDSFPALMCSEDDVVGEHAASVGQIDVEKLFYLMSRGLSEVEARRLLVKASFEEVVGILVQMGEVDLYESVITALYERKGW